MEAGLRNHIYCFDEDTIQFFHSSCLSTACLVGMDRTLWSVR